MQRPEHRRGTVAAAVLLAAVLGLVACGPTADEPADTSPEIVPEVTEARLPDGLLLEAAPEGARGVAEVKAAAKEGDTIVLRGRIGGSLHPFVEGLAVLTVADLETITSCDAMGADDHCPTPWDYCCMAREDMTAGTATVQINGPDGRPLKGGLEGVSGLDPLRVVVVQGTVGPRPDPAVLVVNATGIHIEP